MKTRLENWAAIIADTDERWLTTTLGEGLKEAGFNVIEKVQHQFGDYGFTALWLLGESHLALHTFPENGSSYIELSSCVPDKGDRFWKKIKGDLVFLEDYGKRVVSKE